MNKLELQNCTKIYDFRYKMAKMAIIKVFDCENC